MKTRAVFPSIATLIALLLIPVVGLRADRVPGEKWGLSNASTEPISKRC